MMDDFLDIESAQATDDLRLEGLRIAKLYTVFMTDPRGQELLALWDKSLGAKRTPTNAPHTEYAANEALRAFVAGIHDQIRLAQTLER